MPKSWRPRFFIFLSQLKANLLVVQIEITNKFQINKFQFMCLYCILNLLVLAWVCWLLLNGHISHPQNRWIISSVYFWYMVSSIQLHMKGYNQRYSIIKEWCAWLSCQKGWWWAWCLALHRKNEGSLYASEVKMFAKYYFEQKVSW